MLTVFVTYSYTGRWFWAILEWDKAPGRWYNRCSGIRESYGAAAAEAKEVYDAETEAGKHVVRDGNGIH